jgi:hypothetical protein
MSITPHRSKQNSPIWSSTHGTYLTGRAYLDEADKVALVMEGKWGQGRLRLLVDAPLRARFDRQRYLLNAATWHGELGTVALESERMINAWRALDRAAEAAGKRKLDPMVWETTLADGSVVAIVFDGNDIRRVEPGGRQVAVYTLDEIARFLSVYPDVARAKQVFPGATVERIERQITDPLDSIRDGVSLNDPLDDLFLRRRGEA